MKSRVQVYRGKRIPSYDRFVTVRICKKLGLPFHELVNRRLGKKRTPR